MKKPDIAELILNMQQQLSLLDKKIDILIGQAKERPFNTERPKPFQRFDHSRHQGERRQDNNYRERMLHKAICADCNKECEVPFRPSQDRPVYCKDCFSKRKGGGSFKPDFDKAPREEKKKKFFEKKRPAVKRRKK